ncbi:MAG TPA: ATP-binding cassette domain-containing protein, partial [Spirochaetia bacterium]|nr:ATP-binding cassette domain-containing protein [Spirochaetia bacterium]
MAFIQLSGVSVAFGDRDVLKDINFNLDTGSRIALAGPNGSGKSTLMKVMAGLQRADSGERVIQKETRVAYLPQSGITHRSATLLEEAEQAYAPLHDLVVRKEALETRLGQTTEHDPETEALLIEHHEIQEHLLAADFYQRAEVIGNVLEGLGFSPDDRGRETAEFSGGWQMRIALAKVLLEKPDILLLDEPTNYLDIEARSWLESWLQRFRGGYIIVSHDRYFLDVTVSEVAELWSGSLKRFKGNYTVYERAHEQELEALVSRYEAQQAE